MDWSEYVHTEEEEGNRWEFHFVLVDYFKDDVDYYKLLQNEKKKNEKEPSLGKH